MVRVGSSRGAIGSGGPCCREEELHRPSGSLRELHVGAAPTLATSRWHGRQEPRHCLAARQVWGQPAWAHRGVEVPGGRALGEALVVGPYQRWGLLLTLHWSPAVLGFAEGGAPPAVGLPRPYRPSFRGDWAPSNGVGGRQARRGRVARKGEGLPPFLLGKRPRQRRDAPTPTLTPGPAPRYPWGRLARTALHTEL